MCLDVYFCEFTVFPSVCVCVSVSVLVLEYICVCFHVSGYVLVC